MNRCYDYCEVIAYFDKLNVPNQVFVFKYKSNGKHEEYKTLKLGSVLAELGEFGWELVTAYPLILNSITVTYVFKRVVEQ